MLFFVFDRKYSTVVFACDDHYHISTGHTPLPSARKLNFSGRGRSSFYQGKPQGDSPRYGGGPRGRGQGRYRGGSGGRNRKSDSEDRERSFGVPRWGKGRGTFDTDKVGVAH